MHNCFLKQYKNGIHKIYAWFLSDAVQKSDIRIAAYALLISDAEQKLKYARTNFCISLSHYFISFVTKSTPSRFFLVIWFALCSWVGVKSQLSIYPSRFSHKYLTGQQSWRRPRPSWRRTVGCRWSRSGSCPSSARPAPPGSPRSSPIGSSPSSPGPCAPTPGSGSRRRWNGGVCPGLGDPEQSYLLINFLKV